MDPTPPSQEKKALCELRQVLNQREKFVKVHAAEFLIWTGHSKEALAEFLKEEQLHSGEPKYRVVIWRVLAQAETDPARKQIWLDKIYEAYKDFNGPDRTHATETLAKLKQPVSQLFPEATKGTLISEDRNLAVYALWASSIGSEERMTANREKFLRMVLADTNLVVRKISAFVLRQSRGLSTDQWKRLTSLAVSAGKADDTYVNFLSTALVTAPADADKKVLAQINELLLHDVNGYSVSERTELSQAFAEKGTREHLPVLMGFMKDAASRGIYNPDSDEAADLRATAAYAVLKIKGRKE